MSGSFSSYPTGREDLQHEQEYWIYLPAPTSMNPRERTRDPWSFFEERAIGVPPINYGLARFPPAAATPRPSLPLLLIEDYSTYLGARGPTPPAPPTFNRSPPYNQASIEDLESRLSPEEQKQALNKLRKQLYSPHLNRIIKRLGATSTTSSNNASRDDDDDGKRCAVCLEDFETKQFLTITPCDHMFHEECIVPWVKSQGKCPVCRFAIAEKDRAPPQRARSNANAVVPTFHRGGIERNLRRF